MFKDDGGRNYVDFKEAQVSTTNVVDKLRRLPLPSKPLSVWIEIGGWFLHLESDSQWMGAQLVRYGWILIVSSLLAGYGLGLLWKYFLLENGSEG